MFRNALIASLLALGTAGTALAQDNGPRLIGGGGDGGPRVEYVAPSQNVVGGGFARLTGDSTSRSIAYAGPTAAQTPSGLIAELVGGGREEKLIYEPAPATGPHLAGQVTRHRG
jgi:hypothetical protein